MPNQSVITFSGSVPLEETMEFEQEYEESLRMSLQGKEELLEDTHGVWTWMKVDGKLAGETYGIAVEDLLEDLDEESPEFNADIAPFAKLHAIYCYSTTILAPFQGKGLGKLLKAYWLGQLYGRYGRVIGHSTSLRMKALNTSFGAKHAATPHENWYDSGRQAWFYSQVLNG